MTSSKPQWWSPWSAEASWQAQARKTAAALDTEAFLTWLDGAGVEAANLSYGEVWSRSAFVANWLLGDIGLALGDRAMLVYAPGPEFFVAFVACLRAGVLAVPNYPPDPAQLQRGLEKLDLVTTNCGAEVGLTDSIVNKLRVTTSIWHSWPGIRWYNTEGLGESDNDDDPSRALFHRLVSSRAEFVRSTSSRHFVSSDDAASASWGDARRSEDATPAVATVSLSLSLNTGSSESLLHDDQHEVAYLSRAHGDQEEGNSLLEQFPPDDIAFLQFTSGSTGDPKGVMISHGNIWHNLNEIFLPAQRRALDVRLGEAKSNRLHDLQDHSERIVAVSWLPQFHDLGLVAMLLGPWCAGYHMVSLSPLSFLADPLMWMRAMSKYRAQWTAAPDFAYQLCTKRAANADVSDIDLGCVVYLVGGSGQRCVPSTLREFAAYFAIHCNLPDDGGRGIFVPNYGLAEHVAPTCGEAEGIITSRRRPDLASCGSEFQIDLRIVDEETRCVAPDGTPGELWLSSGSVALGYWGKPELSSETFHARLEPDDGKVYLRTGDEAFIEDGRLFICGRIKDMIIIGGENYYSDDVEIAATEAMVDAVRSGCIAAFSVVGSDDDDEWLCIVLEVRDHAASECDVLASTLTKCVRKAVGLAPRRVVFIKQKTILKTTSGKLRRRAIRDALLAGELSVVFDSNPTLGGKRQTLSSGADCGPNVSRSNSADDGANFSQWLWRLVSSVSDTVGYPLDSSGLAPPEEVDREFTAEADPTLKWSECLVAEAQAQGRCYELSDFLGVWEVLDDHYVIRKFEIKAENTIDDSRNQSHDQTHAGICLRKSMQHCDESQR